MENICDLFLISKIVKYLNKAPSNFDSKKLVSIFLATDHRIQNPPNFILVNQYRSKTETFDTVIV